MHLFQPAERMLTFDMNTLSCVAATSIWVRVSKGYFLMMHIDSISTAFNHVSIVTWRDEHLHNYGTGEMYIPTKWPKM